MKGVSSKLFEIKYIHRTILKLAFLRVLSLGYSEKKSKTWRVYLEQNAKFPVRRGKFL
jgi:hypothetical protein